MASTIIGSGGVNRTLKNIYIGSGGVNRKAKEIYVGNGGVNRKIYTGVQTTPINIAWAGNDTRYSSMYTPFLSIDLNAGSESLHLAWGESGIFNKSSTAIANDGAFTFSYPTVVPAGKKCKLTIKTYNGTTAYPLITYYVEAASYSSGIARISYGQISNWGSTVLYRLTHFEVIDDGGGIEM